MTNYIEFEGGVHSQKELNAIESMGIDKEPELIPAKIYINIFEVSAIMEAFHNGKLSGTNITLNSGESFWVNAKYSNVKGMIQILNAKKL